MRLPASTRVRTDVMRLAMICLVVAACGRNTGRLPDGMEAPADGDGTGDGGDTGDGGIDAAPVTVDAPPDAPPFPSKLDVGINCRNDCVLIASPASISVPAGTKFTVNWINTGDTECDVAKIDQFNQVPILIGLEPGASYHDSIREWCGPFTGTFQFRVTICTIHSYIPVNCGA